jgi:YHS domain-containing protein
MMTLRAHDRFQRRFRWALALVLALGLLSLAQPASAKSAINSSTWAGVAIKGYDPVAYFVESRPVEGSSEFTYEWMGAEWRFASAANRDAFAANPEQYAPQYGGYCAYAVAHGGTADIDPNAWRIVDDKLYLNLSKSVQARWGQDIPGFIAKADANWPEIVAKLTR